MLECGVTKALLGTLLPLWAGVLWASAVQVRLFSPTPFSRPALPAAPSLDAPGHGCTWSLCPVRWTLRSDCGAGWDADRPLLSLPAHCQGTFPPGGHASLPAGSGGGTVRRRCCGQASFCLWVCLCGERLLRPATTTTTSAPQGSKRQSQRCRAEDGRGLGPRWLSGKLAVVPSGLLPLKLEGVLT